MGDRSPGAGGMPSNLRDDKRLAAVERLGRQFDQRGPVSGTFQIAGQNADAIGVMSAVLPVETK